jgi:hypothetical protein
MRLRSPELAVTERTASSLVIAPPVFSYSKEQYQRRSIHNIFPCLNLLLTGGYGHDPTRLAQARDARWYSEFEALDEKVGGAALRSTIPPV